jgi:xylulose-5-phosphate/fructose-6-phosphate phosphoketolase
MSEPLSGQMLDRMDAYWRAANYLSVGQIIHVRGYKEEGTTTTPFDMVVRNQLDRFHLVQDVIDRVPGLAVAAAHLSQHLSEKLLEHHAYTRRYGKDMPEVSEWHWSRER